MIKKAIVIILGLTMSFAISVTAFAIDFSEGLAAVMLNDYGNFGFIDKTGKVVIPIEYQRAYSFSEGLAVVVLNNKWGVIDKAGIVVIPIKYLGLGSFSEGLAMVHRNIVNTSGSITKWGFIDKTGKVVVPLKYDSVTDFPDGIAVVFKEDSFGEKQFDERKIQMGFIDKTGKIILPFKNKPFDVYNGIFST